MDKPTELDLAALRSDMRKMYKDIGYKGAIQVLYEIIISADTLVDVITEEVKNEES